MREAKMHNRFTYNSKNGLAKKDRLRSLFFALSIALTFISLHAGFYFYEAMFGLSVAVVSSFTFESLRIATLYGAIRKDKVNRGIGIILYAGMAFVCGFAGIASFHARIIENYRKDTMQASIRQKKEIETIKLSQADEFKVELERISKDIKWCEVQIAKNPDSEYWARRFEQVQNEEHKVNAMYDSLLSFIPGKDIEGWIEQQSAKYGIERNQTLDSYGKSWATSEAVSEVWKLSGMAAKKLAAIIIVISIELGILMLAMLSRETKRPAVLPTNGRFRQLARKYGEEAVCNFIASSRDHFSQTGKLPMARNLSRKNREIRREILSRKPSANELEEIMEL